MWITISRHLRSKRKSVPLGGAYSAPWRGNSAPTWCLFGAYSAPLSAFPKKMHGTSIFFVTYWIPISPNQPKTHKTPRKSHNAVLFCTRCRKYGIPLLYECILRRGSERKHPCYPAKWGTKSSVYIRWGMDTCTYEKKHVSLQGKETEIVLHRLFTTWVRYKQTILSNQRLNWFSRQVGTSLVMD